MISAEAVRAEARRHRAIGFVLRNAADSADADRSFWAALTSEARVIETWRLSEELWRLRGDFTNEPGLYRSTLRALSAAEVRFLIVGAYALAVHAKPRATVDGLDLPFLGRRSLVANKRATGRPQDLVDLTSLGE